MSTSDFYWIFYKIKTNKYVVVSEKDLKNGELWDLLEDDYHIVWDSALSRDSAHENAADQIAAFLDWYQKDIPLESIFLEQPQQLRLQTIPITLKIAQEFISKFHRHNQAPQGHKFSIGLWDHDVLIGVIIAGSPVARHNNNGFTLEITRCCLKSSIYRNGISKMIGSVYQVAKAMGYTKIITYTLDHESGDSLKSCGFELEAITSGGSWNSTARKRENKAPTTPKKRWVKYVG
ncbi:MULTISPECIES: XF1762 family protein [Bacillus]|uniref:XF1762 family protein n=1 Tax=Bacillus TaxID=1386 RepID=UPI000C77B201|nr:MULTISPECIES: XF1762 family protein [Bacillus]MCP1161243.1 hypothetical protein [Bacillus infantis]PLR70564.1 hypothetical protein CYJ37_23835 [Bacillus sp. UMB0728]